MNALPLIERKRDGGKLASGEIEALIASFTQGAVPDYQMAALLMAIYFRGLNPEETRALTKAMRDSGPTLQFPDDSRPLVDKHSTGGVGDKVSLPLAPLLACLGFRVPMISGRGLGITGGTADKMESIPGFRTGLRPAEIVRVVQDVGCVMCGQTEELCPADRKLYALRDVTGTVPSIPLITASILSKKLAEGIQALVFDVKFGCAAFMPTRERARTLAQLMVEIAAESGIKARALLTDMNTPLGSAAGNWLEVREAVECLENRGPAEVRELVIACAAQLLVITGKAPSLADACTRTETILASGAARRKWDEMLIAQGADLAAFNAKLTVDTHAPCVASVSAAREGFLESCDARIVGEVVRDLGAGRMTSDAAIDQEVGVDGLLSVGGRVEKGAALCRVHARTNASAREAVRRLEAAFSLSSSPCASSPRITEVIKGA